MQQSRRGEIITIVTFIVLILFPSIIIYETLNEEPTSKEK